MTNRKRSKYNHNLKLYHEPTYKGFKLKRSNAPYIEQHLDGLYATIISALNQHHRTLAVRFDLKVPLSGIPIEVDNPIKRFIDAVRARINTHLKQKFKREGRFRSCRLRYAVKVEQKVIALHEHYHVILFVNNDVFRCIQNLGPNDNSALGKIIRDSWHSVAKLDERSTEVLIHSSPTPNRYLTGSVSSDNPIMRAAFEHYSYICKEDSTLYRMNRPSFYSSSKLAKNKEPQ